MTEPRYLIGECSIADVAGLCAKYHGYGSAGGSATYAFGVYENTKLIAAYAWQPPPPGAAKSIAPACPASVLALSRMVAVPKGERELNHVSRPLRHQMKHLIDRGRWPVLVTYSDSSLGHTGHVYKCSGWKPTIKTEVPFFLDDAGNRVSRYSNGKSGGRALRLGGHATIQRWEHRVCASGEELSWIADHGWIHESIPGKVWKSGNQAHRWVKR